MNPKYGYFSINKSLEELWEISRLYWRSQKKMFIKSDTSYTTDKYAKMDLSKKRALKQSEEYYIKFASDPTDSNITYIRIVFEYYGDAFLGATKRMENTINDWIMELNVAPIQFHKKQLKEYEVFFIDMIEDYQKIKTRAKDGGVFCIFCGKKMEEGQKVCQFCGSSND